jgi:hypothetical protein
MSDDPTSIREQPSLTTSSGRIWLIVGGLFTVIALAVLIPLAVAGFPPRGVALAGAIAAGTLYLGMIVVRLTVPAGRLRLGLLAGGLLAIATLSLAAVVIVAAGAWSAT